MRRTLQENEDRTVLKMPASVAREFAAHYGDARTTDPQLRASHAAMMGNPDGIPGIAVHLDTSRAPEASEDATIYGNWGGYTAVDAINVDGEYEGADPKTAWRTQMSSARRGIFRYHLAYGTGGGSNGVGFTASYNMNSTYVSAHETGHSLGLNHDSPFGLSHHANCKPNYPSLMNYAFRSGTSFSDGRTAEGPPLNNWSLPETGVATGQSAPFFDRLENVFGYWVDRASGSVDWNRDVVFAPARTTVRAYANLAISTSGCEHTRYNKAAVDSATTRASSALARLGGRLYLFYPSSNVLRWSMSGSSWNCPVPEDNGCAGGSWRFQGSDSSLLHVVAVDAVTITTDGREEILVVAVDVANQLWERRLHLEGPYEAWTPWRRLAGESAISGPALTTLHGGSVLLAYTDTAGVYRVQGRTADGRWTSEKPFLAADGTQLRRPAGSTFTPAVIEATLPYKPGVPSTYALLAGADDKLDLWYRNLTTARWENTRLLETRPGPVHGRPAVAWVPPGPTSSKGRLHVVYVARANSAVRMMMSYVRVRLDGYVTTRADLVGLDTYFDNTWRKAHSVDLIYESGVDTNLRAVLSYTNTDQLWFHPKADGINDDTYNNYNDWVVLAKTVCTGVVNPGLLVNNPIRCFP